MIPRAGKIIAFTVRLGNPDANQVQFFEDLYGDPPQVQLSILRRGEQAQQAPHHRLLAQSPACRLEHYFGSAPTFMLDKPLDVARQEHRRAHRAHLGAGVRRRACSATTGGARRGERKLRRTSSQRRAADQAGLR